MGKNKSVAYALAGFCLISLFFSCNSTSKNQIGEHKIERYSINPEATTLGIKNSQYSVDSICSLSLPDDIAEIGVDKISVVNGCVYILDTYITKKLYIFDSNGNLKTVIGERGNAKGEFAGKPDEFFVDSNNKLHVFDEIGHRINVFKPDGSIDHVIKTSEFFPQSFGLTSNDRYMMYFTVGHKGENTANETPAALLLLDQNCKKYKDLMSSEGDSFCNISNHTFFQDCGRLSFIPSFSDSVIVFKNDTVEKVVSFDFGGRVLCKEMPEARIQDEGHSFMENYQGMLGLSRYQETNSLIYLEYIYKECGLYWLYNKNNGQTAYGNNLFEGVNPYSYFCLNENQIIAYVDDKIVNDFKQYYHNKAFQDNLNKSPKQMKDIMEGKIKVPALFFITIKE
jgi:hypothetical protein